MHWLEQLDVALFRFINGTLSNPFFDQLMPFVSRNPFGGPLRWPLIIAIAIFSAIIIRKRMHRVALCAAMAGIVIGVGDGLICRNLKHTIQRPRPYCVLPDVNRPGQSQAPAGAPHATLEQKGIVPPQPPVVNTNSMPSAHAANWFAGTMVALIYFRKSIRIMLPVACLVSFSRVYNGVHYPSDVLAGSLIGAGTAVAVLWVLSNLWQWLGPKCLPKLYSSMPSLTSFNKSFSSSSSFSQSRPAAPLASGA